jgi:hypothetical protein
MNIARPKLVGRPFRPCCDQRHGVFRACLEFCTPISSHGRQLRSAPLAGLFCSCFVLAQHANVSNGRRRLLATAKDRGVKLGGFRGRAATADDRARASAALTAKADEHAASLAPILARLDPEGSLSLRALKAKLTADGLPTPAGAAVWTAATVARVKARLVA